MYESGYPHTHLTRTSPHVHMLLTEATRRIRTPPSPRPPRLRRQYALCGSGRAAASTYDAREHGNDHPVDAHSHDESHSRSLEARTEESNVID